MKPLAFSTIMLLTLAACGQTPNSSNSVSKTSSVSKDTTTIYRNISLETCNCTFSTMKNNKPSTSMDSCYQAVLLKYNDSLKQLGFNPATQVGQNKLSTEVVGKLYHNCPDLSRLIQKEYAAGNAKKLLFKGSIVSQKQLSSGEFEIVLLNNKSKAKQIFKSKNPLYNPSISDKNILSYETTVEYEIRHNSKTNKNEYYIKDGATGSGVSIQKVNVPE
jgi:hypothetical protein